MSLAVPFVQQIDPSGCGAAALEMILKFHGVEADQNDIFTRLAKPDPHNDGLSVITIGDIKTEVARHGLFAHYGKISVNDTAKTYNDIGFFVCGKQTPLIACQTASPLSTVLHYRVIYGLDKKGVYFHDPLTKNSKGTYQQFEQFNSLWIKNEQLKESGVCIYVAKNEIEELRPKLPGLGGKPWKS